ncbi:MAG: cell division ATP-binding protein FtsE [Clostridia bacterium]|nr:cell division ATP-binding protein FtsE [Clostridia bacterium]
MITMKNVRKTYENGADALKGVSLDVADGEFVFIVGPSGSGKSTLTKILTGEVQATDGEVIVNGFDLNRMRRYKLPKLRRTLGIIFQDFRLIEDKTVYQNIEFVMRVVGARPRKIKERVGYVLKLVGLEDKMRCLPRELSGGEQQRVAIARALANNPKLIIADEPSGNIDPELSRELMALLVEINKKGVTILVVTHEEELVNEFTNRVVVINRGEVVRDGTGGYYGNV